MNREEYAAYLDSPAWRMRREEFKRDHGRRCVACGSPSRLHVHHVRYDHWGAGQEPDRDLRVLCEEHHEMVHDEEKSGHFGRFMAAGTLAAATDAVIARVQAEIASSKSAVTPGRSTAPARPPRRREAVRPPARSRRGNRGRRRSRIGLAVGAALVVAAALISIGMVTSATAPAPVSQAPPSVRSVTSTTVARSVPAAQQPYVVRPGDTLERIARKSGVSVDDLLRWNPDITDSDYIDIGQAIQTRPPG